MRYSGAFMDMADIVNSPKPGTIEPTILTFAVSDPEVLLGAVRSPEQIDQHLLYQVGIHLNHQFGIFQNYFQFNSLLLERRLH